MCQGVGNESALQAAATVEHEQVGMFPSNIPVYVGQKCRCPLSASIYQISICEDLNSVGQKMATLLCTRTSAQMTQRFRLVPAGTVI